MTKWESVVLKEAAMSHVQKVTTSQIDRGRGTFPARTFHAIALAVQICIYTVYLFQAQ